MKGKSIFRLLAIFIMLGSMALAFSSCAFPQIGSNSRDSYSSIEDIEDSSSIYPEDEEQNGEKPNEEEPSEEELVPSEGLEYSLVDDAYWVTGTGVCVDTDLVIPAVYEEKPVVGISSRAFYEFTALTSVVIPDSVISIGDEAFLGCTSLKKVVMGDSVKTIGDRAFCKCSQLTDINIPDSVESIGYYAFGSERLKLNEYKGGYYLGNQNNPYVVLESLKNDELTTYTIHEKNRIVGSSVFYNCKNLVTITIPDSVVFIGEYAFGKCTRLVSVKLGASLKAIGSGAFLSCSTLESIDLVKGIERIEYSAFEECSNLQEIAFPDGIQYVGESAFDSCKKLKKVSIPNTDANIMARFSYCETATIPAHMISCVLNRNLKSVKIIGGDTIVAGAFCYFEGYTCDLTEISISASVTSIAENVFSGCMSLKSITVDENNQNYKSIDGNLYTKDGTIFLQYAVGKKEEKFVIPNGVLTISNSAFYKSNLKSIKFSDSVESIGNAAFYMNKSLEDVALGKSLKTIGAEAFRWCSALTSFTFKGSMADWKAIEKGGYWRHTSNYYYIPAKFVECSDGSVNL